MIVRLNGVSPVDSRSFLYHILIELSRSEAIYRRRRSVSSRGFARTGPPDEMQQRQRLAGHLFEPEVAFLSGVLWKAGPEVSILAALSRRNWE